MITLYSDTLLAIMCTQFLDIYMALTRLSVAIAICRLRACIDMTFIATGVATIYEYTRELFRCSAVW